MNILGLCGSLRAESSNACLLAAAASFYKAAGATWQGFECASLPFFDPDTQYGENTPQLVTEMRTRAGQADLIFIATPEYAHGVPGLLKNALEWLFCDLTSRKPVLVVVGSAQGESTRAQLVEILTTMDFVITENEILLLKGARAKIGAHGFIDDAERIRFERFCAKFKA